MEGLTRREYKSQVQQKRIVGAGINKIRNSYNIYNYYCNYKKVRPKRDPHWYLLWWQYSEIIHAMHKLMREELFTTGSVDFPYKLGTLYLVKKTNILPRFKDGKLKVPYMVNWDKTLDLWYDDEEAREKKTIVYLELKNRHAILFRKKGGKYKNQRFYKFKTTRELGHDLFKRMKANTLDNFFLAYG